MAAELKFDDQELQALDQALAILKRRVETAGLMDERRLGAGIEHAALDFDVPRDCRVCASGCENYCYTGCKGDCANSCKGDCNAVNKLA